MKTNGPLQRSDGQDGINSGPQKGIGPNTTRDSNAKFPEVHRSASARLLVPFDPRIAVLKSDWDVFCSENQELIDRASIDDNQSDRAELRTTAKDYFSQHTKHNFLAMGYWGAAFLLDINAKPRVIKLTFPGREEAIQREKSNLKKIESLVKKYKFVQSLSCANDGTQRFRLMVA